MVHLISLVKPLHMEVPIGLDEIKLVRKVLDWKHKPFEIPKNILNEWRKIGNKGAKLDSAWSKIYKRKKQDSR